MGGMSAQRYTVAVRALCEFAAKQGDLDLRFTPSPTSQQGIAGHRTVAASRSASYRSEVRLSGEYRHLVVRGRADGYDPDRHLLEEVKTFKGDLGLMPENHRQLLDSLRTVLQQFQATGQQDLVAQVAKSTMAFMIRHIQTRDRHFVAWERAPA